MIIYQLMLYTKPYVLFGKNINFVFIYYLGFSVFVFANWKIND